MNIRAIFLCFPSFQIRSLMSLLYCQFYNIWKHMFFIFFLDFIVFLSRGNCKRQVSCLPLKNKNLLIVNYLQLSRCVCYLLIQNLQSNIYDYLAFRNIRYVCFNIIFVIIIVLGRVNHMRDRRQVSPKFKAIQNDLGINIETEIVKKADQIISGIMKHWKKLEPSGTCTAFERYEDCSQWSYDPEESNFRFYIIQQVLMTFSRRMPEILLSYNVWEVST